MDEAAAVEPYQWFLLGMMVAWTPTLVVLALLLRRAHHPKNHVHTSDHTRNEHDGLVSQKGRPGSSGYQPYNQDHRRPKAVKP
jgi:hypothetical protein